MLRETAIVKIHLDVYRVPHKGGKGAHTTACGAVDQRRESELQKRKLRSYLRICFHSTHVSPT